MDMSRSPKRPLETTDQGLDSQKRPQLDPSAADTHRDSNHLLVVPSINFDDHGQDDGDLEAEAAALEPLSDGWYDDWLALCLADGAGDDGLQSSQENEVECYGMLPAINFQLKWLPASSSSSSPSSPAIPTPEGSTGHIAMQLELKPEHGILVTEAGDSIAVLNQRSFDALYAAVGADDKGCEVEAWISRAEWDAKTAELRDLSKNKRKEIKMATDLFLYGPGDAEIRDQVAESLGKSRCYLQDPHPGLSRHPYSNPQSLDIAGLSTDLDESEVMVSQNLFATMNDDDVEDYTTEKMTNSSAVQQKELINDIDAFMDTIPHRPPGQPIFKDNRLLSPMFRHQEEGFDFMVSRETEASYHNGLWETLSLENGQVCFRHTITGAKSRNPDGLLGGILADDMGLGKTFTTLVAILASQGHAADFAAVQRATKSPSRTTVVVVPSELLLTTWVREIESRFYPGSIRYGTYHGPERLQLEGQVHQQDILLTTYGTVMADRRRGNSILYRRQWYRLVLDEAHTIRNWGGKQFNAIQDISSHIRWCLTGTPIQNSLDDSASLVRFLKMPLFEDPAIFRKYVTKVRYSRESAQHEFTNLRLLLSAICLRRNKTVLPTQAGHQVEDRRPAFDPHEQQQYQSLARACRRAVLMENKGNGEVDRKSHSRVMEALLRLRMFCNNGLSSHAIAYSADTSSSSPRRLDETLSFFQQSGEAACADCSVDIVTLGDLSDLGSGYLTPCWRLVCDECKAHLKSQLSVGGSSSAYTCPFCHEPHSVSSDYDDNAGQEQSATDSRTYPTKIRSLVDDVQAHYLESKCIVFSFWRTTLDVVGSALQKHGVKYLRVDGGLTPKKRNATLLEFQNKSTWRVLIMTFSTGSVGLNGLTVADRVHILEPQWNPAAESQAIGRVLRLDQQRKVTIVRYAMLKSIEEVVQSKQLRKLQLATGGFDSQGRKEQIAVQLQHLEQCLEPSCG